MSFIASVFKNAHEMLFELADTKYFNALKPKMGLDDRSVYAEAVRRGSELDNLLTRGVAVPLVGKYFYSPGGAAVVESANEFAARMKREVEAAESELEFKQGSLARAKRRGDSKSVDLITGEIGDLSKTIREKRRLERSASDPANKKWQRAVVVSPGTAVLGLGTVEEKSDGVLLAGAAGPIMIGKAAYFSYAAGVNTEPITVETQMFVKDVSLILADFAEQVVEQFLPKYAKKNVLINSLIQELERQILPQREAGQTKSAWGNQEIYWNTAARNKAADIINRKLLSVLKREGILAPSDQVSKTGKGLDGQKVLAKIESIRSKITQYSRAAIFAQTVARISNNYGFINVEDAQGSDLPLILGMLESMNLNSAIWSDDLQGTGVITAAGVLSWAEQTGRMKKDRPDKPLEGVKVVIFGAGAGALGVRNELVNLGVRPEDIRVTDTGPDKDRSGKPYMLHEGRSDITEDDPYKWAASRNIKEEPIEDFIKGLKDGRPADVVINLGDEKTLTGRPAWTEEITRSLAPNPLFAPMTNPDPGIKPEWLYNVRSDAFYASGNQLYENVFNNFVAFSFIGLGALVAGATKINKEMTTAAAWAIHRVAKMGAREGNKDYGKMWLVPHPLDTRLIMEEAKSVAMAAARSGVSIFVGADPTEEALRLFEEHIDEQLLLRKNEVEKMRLKIEKEAHDYYKSHYRDRYAPFYLKPGDKDPCFYISPEIKFSHFKQVAENIGLTEDKWEGILKKKGVLKPKALAEVLESLKAKAYEADDLIHRIAQEELGYIVKLSHVSPALGLALAVRRLRSWSRPENLIPRPTVFNKNKVMDCIRDLMPDSPKIIEELTAFYQRSADRMKPPNGNGGGNGGGSGGSSGHTSGSGGSKSDLGTGQPQGFGASGLLASSGITLDLAALGTRESPSNSPRVQVKRTQIHAPIRRRAIRPSDAGQKDGVNSARVFMGAPATAGLWATGMQSVPAGAGFLLQ